MEYKGAPACMPKHQAGKAQLVPHLVTLAVLVFVFRLLFLLVAVRAPLGARAGAPAHTPSLAGDEDRAAGVLIGWDSEVSAPRVAAQVKRQQQWLEQPRPQRQGDDDGPLDRLRCGSALQPVILLNNPNLLHARTCTGGCGGHAF